MISLFSIYNHVNMLKNTKNMNATTWMLTSFANARSRWSYDHHRLWLLAGSESDQQSCDFLELSIDSPDYESKFSEVLMRFSSSISRSVSRFLTNFQRPLTQRLWAMLGDYNFEISGYRFRPRTNLRAAIICDLLENEAGNRRCADLLRPKKELKTN